MSAKSAVTVLRSPSGIFATKLVEGAAVLEEGVPISVVVSRAAPQFPQKR
jgi:hypothetical protein